MRSLVLLLVLAACGGSHPRPTANTKAEAPAEPASSPGCPTTYAAAKGTCGGSLDCHYPDGDCVCSREMPCSGTRLPPSELANLKDIWTCTPKVRADGCPGQLVQGAACTTPDKECVYAPCGGSAFTCKEGKWTFERDIPGPP
jgi:hypothetical protein